MSISPLDRAIIACLQIDPRMQNRAIASRVGVTQQTVANRLRQLIEGKVIRVLAQRDFARAGYSILSFAEISVGQVAVEAVAAKLADLAEVFSVVICPGTPDIIANINLRSPEDLRQIRRRIKALPGVFACEMTVARKVFKLVSDGGDLSSPIKRTDPPKPEEPIDEAIIALLVEDGRLSNREIARQLGVSEGNIRARLKRMTNENVMRIGLVCEPDRVGFDHSAYIFFDGDPGDVDRALQNLKHHSAVSFAASAEGQYGAVLLGVAAKVETLHRLCINEIRQMPGIGRIVFRPMFRTVAHRFDFIKIGSEDEGAEKPGQSEFLENLLNEATEVVGSAMP
ncbi:Lrp/AsnC family transcriptional regulator [Novosphingobium cyanobacteriorum]|uniref:Lrp/AsnC family transcriptional regulator n=1 Tax=Novosphingobium cyanobacteriorum TaxID=3024215 RepID=A0ABT6CP41_9SPHN|nr:Lrp/AsnC family transcriptional regulator [Novosphingobium cyanobacteriorum]MDF8335675.1 Lrp/AsnC family transcriptional regulator [Novosphingobium cyanobacteriorum]